MRVEGGAPELSVTITAREQTTFADALYGAEAYAPEDGRWRRVDTADVRAQVAPLLGAGESATVALPVEDAPSYRVLVPVAGRAAWGGSAGGS